MSTATQSFETLFYNPLILAPLIEAFYEKAIPQPRNILLAYIVLPLTLYPESRSFLKRASKRSSLRTLFKKSSRIYGLPRRVKEYTDLTNSCLQFAIDMGSIKLEDDLSVQFLTKKLDTEACPFNAIKAASNLPKVLHPYDVPAIYRYLGIRAI